MDIIQCDSDGQWLVFPPCLTGSQGDRCQHGDLVPCLTVEWRSRTPRWGRPQNKSQNQTALSGWSRREQCWQREGRYLEREIFLYVLTHRQLVRSCVLRTTMIINKLNLDVRCEGSNRPRWRSWQGWSGRWLAWRGFQAWGLGGGVCSVQRSSCCQVKKCQLLL